MRQLSIAISLLTPVLLLGEPKLTSEVVMADKDGRVIVRMQLTFPADDPREYLGSDPPDVQFGNESPLLKQLADPFAPRKRIGDTVYGNRFRSKITWYENVRGEVPVKDLEAMKVEFRAKLVDKSTGGVIEVPSCIEFTTLAYTNESRLKILKNELGGNFWRDQNEAILNVSRHLTDRPGVLTTPTRLWLLGQWDLKRNPDPSLPSTIIRSLDDSSEDNEGAAYLRSTDHPVAIGRAIALASNQLQNRPVAVNHLLKCKSQFVKLMTATEVSTHIPEVAFRDHVNVVVSH